VLQDHVFIYNFMDLKLVLQIDTTPNLRGLCCLCASAKNAVVACPGASKGEVTQRRPLLAPFRHIQFPPTPCPPSLFLSRLQVRIELLSQRKTALVAAHDTQLAALALAHDGTRLATASQKGTIVRIFDCATALPLRELRRGSTSAGLYCLSFNSLGNRICCSSDTSESAPRCVSRWSSPQHRNHTGLRHPSAGTIHIFSLDDGGEATASAAPGSGAVANTTSKMGLLKGLLPKYFSSEWSFAQWKCDSPEAVVAFSPIGHNHIYVLSTACSFSKLSFDAAAGRRTMFICFEVLANCRVAAHATSQAASRSCPAFA
jgi:hypothetical protein